MPILETLGMLGGLFAGGSSLFGSIAGLFGGGSSDTEDQVRRSIRWSNQWAKEDRERMQQLFWPYQEEQLRYLWEDIPLQRAKRELDWSLYQDSAEQQKQNYEYFDNLMKEYSQSPIGLANQFASREARLTVPAIRKAYETQRTALDRNLGARGITATSGPSLIAQGQLAGQEASDIGNAFANPMATYLRSIPNLQLQMGNLLTGKAANPTMSDLGGTNLLQTSSPDLTTGLRGAMALLENQQGQEANMYSGLGSAARQLAGLFGGSSGSSTGSTFTSAGSALSQYPNLFNSSFETPSWIWGE